MQADVLAPQGLRRRLYALALASVIVPPVAGNAILLFAEVFPFPDWIWLFTDAGGLVMVVFVIIALSVVPPIYRLVVGLPEREPEDAARIIGNLRVLAPWGLLGFVVVYSVVGLYSADLALQRLGLVLQPISEVPLLALSPVPVAIITAFPIYFVFSDTLGRYLAPRGVVATLLPLRFRLIVLGTATPFFVDSFLVGYFYSRTGYLSPETFGVWLTLLVLAAVGTLFAERGMRQSTEPLQSYLSGSDGQTGSLSANTLDELGELTSLLSDLVAQKEAALTELREVQRNARLGTWSLSKDGIMNCSEEALQILGIDPESDSVNLMTIAAQFDAEEAEMITRCFSGAGGRHSPFKLNLSSNSQEKPPTILFSGVPSEVAAEGEVSWSGFVQDVSESVAKERQLQAAQRLESVGKISGGAAHDFNNLLAIILGNLELLRDDEKDPERIELIDSSMEATKRGANLTRSMLSFARRSTLQPSVINLNDTVRNMKNWLSRTIPATIDVETSLLAGIWTTKIDPSLAENAILNLVLNARDAMPEGGKLTIETANLRIDDDYLRARQEDLESGRYVMLAISDTGSGIPHDQVETIFEPFYSTKPVGAGSGMGLSMVQGFMRQSGGTIRVYSELGTGTTIKLYFKAMEAYGDARVPVEDDDHWEPADGHDRNILIVEDEIGVLNALKRTIERAGYHVRVAETGDEA
ncbi:MAG: ATP-binding protein, partial [Paracoccaceae bacterium]|nr:ATP-binding protein [Paracoccaceae bacterium]